jgi:hypothetical protein
VHWAIAIEDAKQVFGGDQVYLRPITFCERRPSGLTHVNRRSERTSGWVSIKTKTVQIWEFCAYEGPG